MLQEKFDIIIQGGQSNAEGMGGGPVTEEYIPSPDVLYLEAEKRVEFFDGGMSIEYSDNPFRIKQAEERFVLDSVHGDSVLGDFSLTFAQEYIKNGLLAEGRKLLIVRAAIGGTGFKKGYWGLEDKVYLKMLEMVNYALSLNPENRVVAFLWHQGEHDAFEGNMPEIYHKKLTDMLCDVRSSYGYIPFIAADFVNEWKSKNIEICEPIVETIRQVTKENGKAAFVETADLLSNNQKVKNGDDIHFCRQSLHELGRRYFLKYYELQGIGSMNNLKGTCYRGEFVSTIYKDAVFPYTLYIPENCKDKENCALLVTHDGINKIEALSAEELFKTGEMPRCITLGVGNGYLNPKIGAFPRALRMNTYDVFGERYPNFLVDELIPYIIKTYAISIANDPNMHMISGGSSGGVSSWNVAWHRNDYFRRVYMSSPSFLAMGEGEKFISLIRKCETKPIRVYMDFSENEPDDYFGSSYCVADGVKRALEFSRYDMQSAYYPGEGHCSRLFDHASALERMRFIWKDWDKIPVKVPRFSSRVEKILSVQEAWQITDKPFPKKIKPESDGTFFQRGKYEAEKNKIVFKSEGKKLEAEIKSDHISSMNLSADKCRLYVGDKEKNYIYALTVLPDGSLQTPYVFATLHNGTEYAHVGVYDMCVDREDRVYVSTEIGIQCIRSYGLVDVIIQNPDEKTAQLIEIGEDGYLYAMAGDLVYRRKLVDKQPSLNDRQTKPKQTGYYD